MSVPVILPVVMKEESAVSKCAFCGEVFNGGDDLDAHVNAEFEAKRMERSLAVDRVYKIAKVAEDMCAVATPEVPSEEQFTRVMASLNQAEKESFEVHILVLRMSNLFQLDDDLEYSIEEIAAVVYKA